MSEEYKELKKLCACGKNKALSKHICPYNEDVNGDSSKTCNCCVDCMNKCAADI